MAESAPTDLIDVHAHLITQDYLTSMNGAGISDVGGFPMPDWSVQAALGVMDNHGIAASLLSISAPGIDFVSGRGVAASGPLGQRGAGGNRAASSDTLRGAGDSAATEYRSRTGRA